MTLLILSLILQSSAPAWWIDGTPLVPGIMEIDRRHDPSFEPTGPLSSCKGHSIGDTINFWSIDHSDDLPVFYLTPAHCRISRVIFSLIR